MNGKIEWGSPYVAMVVVLCMYLAKIAAKLAVGYGVPSPMIAGDGWHNVADVIEASLVIVMLWLARRPKNDRYPFGRKNAESLVTLATALGLLVLSVRLGTGAVFGLAGSWGRTSFIAAWDPFLREELDVGPLWSAGFWASLAVTGGSAALSFAVGRYQVSVGRASGHPSIVADGEETRSDGYVESVVLVGVLAKYALGAPALEHAFTLGIAFLLARTGRELFLSGYHALLQHSLGKDVETAIADAVMAVHGVVDVGECKTFAVGHQAVVLLKVHTRAPTEAQRMLKKALVARIERVLASFDRAESDVYVRFDWPSPHAHRIAFALSAVGTVAANVVDARAFRVCDISDGEVVRAFDVAAPGTLDRRIALLRRKRVGELRIWADALPSEAAALSGAGIACVMVERADPAVHGCDPESPYDA